MWQNSFQMSWRKLQQKNAQNEELGAACAGDPALTAGHYLTLKKNGMHRFLSHLTAKKKII